MYIYSYRQPRQNDMWKRNYNQAQHKENKQLGKWLYLDYCQSELVNN